MTRLNLLTCSKKSGERNARRNGFATNANIEIAWIQTLVSHAARPMKFQDLLWFPLELKMNVRERLNQKIRPAKKREILAPRNGFVINAIIEIH